MSTDTRLESLAIIRDVIARLMDRFASKLQSYNPKVQETYYSLQLSFPQANDVAVTKMLSSLEAAELLERGVFVYLEAVEKGSWILPILSFKVDLNNWSNPEVRFRVGIVLVGDDATGRDTCSIGFRFETPEGSKGVHNYYHAQPFLRFIDNGDSLPGCPEWFPTQHPAIPLGAMNEIGLLVCCITSIYGPELLNELVTNLDPSKRKRLRDSSLITVAGA